MMADKLLLVQHADWFDVASDGYREIPAFPKLKVPTLVVTDFDEAPMGVLRFEGKPAYAAAFVEKHVRSEGLTDGATHVVLHRVSSVPGGCLAFYTAVPLAAWQQMQQWAQLQSDHCMVLPLAGLLDGGLKRGQARVLRAGRMLYLTGINDAGMFHVSASSIGRGADDLHAAVRALATQARAGLQKGIKEAVQWACVQGNDEASEAAYAAVFAQVAQCECQLLAHQRLRGGEQGAVISGLPSLCAALPSAAGHASALGRLAWWAESWVAPLAAAAAVVALGLMGLGVVVQNQASAESRWAQQQSGKVQALETRIANANKTEAVEGFAAVADFAKQLGDGAAYDPVAMLQMVRHAAGTDIRIQRVKLESGFDKKRSFRIDGQTEKNGLSSISRFLSLARAAGWKADPLDPAEQSPGAFSYRLTALAPAPL